MKFVVRRLLVFAALLLISCHENEPREAQPPLVAPPTATTGERATAATGQEVQLIEYAIRMPQTLQAGKQSFQIENAGKEMHSLEIEGNGIHEGIESPLSRGSRAGLEIDLPPGTYTVYCPVEDHRQRGMTLQVTVQ